MNKMSNKQCPHCEKMIEHRKICPVLGKIQQKEAATLNKQKIAEEKIATIRLNNEIEELSINHPQVVKYIKTLEEKICDLENEINHIKRREHFERFGPSSYDGEDY